MGVLGLCFIVFIVKFFFSSSNIENALTNKLISYLGNEKSHKENNKNNDDYNSIPNFYANSDNKSNNEYYIGNAYKNNAFTNKQESRNQVTRTIDLENNCDESYNKDNINLVSIPNILRNQGDFETSYNNANEYLKEYVFHINVNYNIQNFYISVLIPMKIN